MPATAARSDTTVIITMSTASVSKHHFDIYTSMQLLQRFPLSLLLLFFWFFSNHRYSGWQESKCEKLRLKVVVLNEAREGKQIKSCKTHLASSSLAMRRRMWLVAEAALKTSTALQIKGKHYNWQSLYGGFKSNLQHWQYYLSLVTPMRLSPFTSKIWSPGIRLPETTGTKWNSYEDQWWRQRIQGSSPRTTQAAWKTAWDRTDVQ